MSRADNPAGPRVYLQDLPLEEALARFHEALNAAGLWAPIGPEEIPVEQALSRVTA